MDNPPQRKIILIKRALQFKIAALMAAAIALTAVLLLVDFYYLLGKIFVAQADALVWQEMFWASLPLVLTNVACLIAAIGVAAIFVSHHLAGPIYRIEESIKRMAEGDFSFQIKLREGDDLVETAAILNQVINLLREKLERDQNLAERIVKQLSILCQKAKEGQISSENFCLELQNIKLEVDHIGKGFKIE